MHGKLGGINVLDRHKAALVVIDVQEKLFAVMDGRDRLLQRTLQLIQGCQVMDLPVIWSEQYPQGMGPTLQPVAALLKGVQPFPKKAFSLVIHSPGSP